LRGIENTTGLNTWNSMNIPQRVEYMEKKLETINKNINYVYTQTMENQAKLESILKKWNDFYKYIQNMHAEEGYYKILMKSLIEAKFDAKEARRGVDLLISYFSGRSKNEGYDTLINENFFYRKKN